MWFNPVRMALPHPRSSRWRRYLGPSALALSLATAPGCREEGTIRVASIELSGVNSVDQGELERALATRESSWLPWGRKFYFDRSRFDADLKRIQAFYADRGFPDARVQSVNVELNDERDAVAVKVAIDEGQPIVVRELVFEGLDEMPRRRVRRLRRTSALREGQPLNRQAFAATREASVNLLADHGYPYATVEAISEPIGGDPKQVRVVYRAAPGAKAVFGPVEIAGNASVDDNVIRRELTYKPGDVYSRSQLRSSQQELYSLELFEFANVEPQLESQPAEIPTRITVAEGKHRRVNFGVGYGTEEKFRTDAEWRHTNFFGDARTAGVHGRWSSLDRGLRLNFTQPYFVKPHLSLSAAAEGWNTAQPLYDADILGGRLTLTHRKSTRDMWSVSLVSEYKRSAVTAEALEDFSLRDELIALGLDPRDGTQQGTSMGLEFDLQRNATDRLLDARRGYYAAVHLEQAGAWLPGSFDYYSLTADGRYYFTIARRAVVASRLQFGALDGLGPARDRLDEGRLVHVPFSERFFLGGSTSLRGWGRFEVSPLSGAGLPVGGRSMVEVSSELRVPVWGNLSVVAFMDAGNVWDEPWTYRVGDLRYAVGPGLRYRTPIGPVRADFGYQLTPIEGLLVDGEPEPRRWRIHFSIGQAF
jgi:outer membrane protein assembly complex protein YaeT